jgi:D-arabinose 1-dehydrogenase-like Zn-dependent alcohol dehydrogenase
VTKFKVGDFAAVGAMVDSCVSCDNCKHGEEHLCTGSGTVMTYNSECAINEHQQASYKGWPHLRAVVLAYRALSC